MNGRPDILVLGSGGAAGVNWLTGVLASLEDRAGFALSDCEYLIGTSAGSLVAARLAAGLPLRRPADLAAGDRSGQHDATSASWALGFAAPLASLGLRLATRPGQLARAAGLRLAHPQGDTIGLADAVDSTWDGRLRVIAVQRRSGRRVVFGAPGAPDATVLEALHASCSVPWLFAPTLIDGVEYVDGGVWSPTSLDVAPATRGSRVLCLCPTGSFHGPLPLALRVASRTAALAEAATVTGRGARVQLITPDRASAAAMTRNLMADETAPASLAAGYQQGLRTQLSGGK